MKRLSVFIFALAFVLCSCSASLPGSEKINASTGTRQLSAPVAGDTVVCIKTSQGDIKVLLFPEFAPKAVQNFITLAQNGYYDNCVFHRAIENFLIQSGSPDSSPGGGNSIWGFDFEDEFSGLLHHYNGALSMANHGADTNGSQFFFVCAPMSEISDDSISQMQAAGWKEDVIESYRQAGGLPQLDYRYTVFGQVYEGLNVVYKISRAKTDDNNRPKKDIVIESVSVSIVE